MDGGSVSLNNSPLDQYPYPYSDHTESNTSVIMTYNDATFVENKRETALPNISLDQFDFSLPLTPDSSLQSCSENGETPPIDNNLVESNLLDGMSAESTLLISPVDIDHIKSQTYMYVNTEAVECNDGIGPSYIQGSGVQKLSSSNQIHEKNCVFEKENEEEGKCDQSENVGLEKKGKDDKLGEPVSKKDEKKVPVSKSCDTKSKKSSLLQFPPCVICSGRATGSHYGAITCEACKGFFRRHLQKKKDFKCTKGGNCEIVSIKKGICSGCRLKKCLDLGMSKEKSKMGRYTLTKRTEAIINMNLHEGKQSDGCDLMKNDEVANQIVMEANNLHVCEDNSSLVSKLSEEYSLLMSHLLKIPHSLNVSQGFNDLLVKELVHCFSAYDPFGPHVKTKEQIAQAHRTQSVRYKQKVELFGKMKTISKEEYNEIYTQCGIDIDGRLADMKLECTNLDDDMSFICNFAKHIPGFSNFPLLDKVSLLNTLMVDFFTVVFLDCYNDEYKTFIARNGRGYHFEEIAGREYSENLVTLSKNVHCRLQSLNLNTEERTLTAALTLVSPDRCKLQNRVLVEKVQLSLTELLQTYLKKNRKEAGNGRFTKIIDTLTYMREMCDQHRKENNELCKDEVLQREFPIIKEFIINESD